MYRCKIKVKGNRWGQSTIDNPRTQETLNTRHITETHKTKQKRNTEMLKVQQHRPNKQTGVNPCARGG